MTNFSTLSQENVQKRNVSETFAHAWSIVDHSSRLIKLIGKLTSQNNHKVLDSISQVNILRNTIQHLHERIDESLIENRSPFYGILIWHHKNLDTGKFIPKILYSGINYGSHVTFTIPDISNSNDEINSITLQTVDKKKIVSLNLSDLLYKLQSICRADEVEILKFFDAQGWSLFNWSSHQDILVSLKSNEDNT